VLTEFAFTPSIFEEAIQPDPGEWRSRLERLAERMFPQGYPPPVIIGDLYSGSWNREAAKLLPHIKDTNARTLAMNLFTQMSKHLVERPAVLAWPEGQMAWCQEALESAKAMMEPIERIVACRFAIQGENPLPQGIRCLSEVRDAGFWSGIPGDDSPAMEIRAQVGLLRKFCVHAGFITLVTPHVNAGDDDETDFAIELMRAALKCRAGRAGTILEIHTDGPRDALPSDPGIARYASAIKQKISRDLGKGHAYQLTLWPKLLHRRVIAGDMTKDAAGQPVKRARWAVAADHFARAGDERRGLRTAEWKLLRSNSVADLAKEFCSSRLKGHLHSESVVS
jgi:hypothetical protein